MTWNFNEHPIENMPAHMRQIRQRAGEKAPLVPGELTETAAQEATRKAGGVAVELHPASKKLARDPATLV